MSSKSKVLIEARSDLGYTEGPNNWTIFGERYGVNKAPWCGIWVWDVFRRAGVDLERWCNNPAYTPTLRNDLARMGWEVNKHESEPGDIVLFDFRGRTRVGVDHVGIVETKTDAGIVSLEGNTALGNDSHGGRVMRRARDFSLIDSVFRIPESLLPKCASTEPAQQPTDAAYAALQSIAVSLNAAKAKVLQTGSTGEAVVWLQTGLNAKGSVLHVDGSFGPETYKAVKRFQRSRGLVTDGVVGPATWNSLFPTG